MPTRNGQKPERSPWKLFLWTAIAGLVFGLVSFGEIAEDALRVARNALHKHQASGDIVLVEFDDRALRTIGRWPWPRSQQAALVDALSRAGARRIFFDLTFSGASRPADDAALAESIARSGRVTLAVKSRSGPNAGTQQDDMPLEMFGRNARLGLVSVIYNYQNAVWRVPYAGRVRFDEREPGRDRELVPEVARERHERVAGLAVGELPREVKGAVAAPVVHEHDLHDVGLPCPEPLDLVDEKREDGRLVVERDDEGDRLTTLRQDSGRGHGAGVSAGDLLGGAEEGGARAHPHVAVGVLLQHAHRRQAREAVGDDACDVLPRCPLVQ